jgi:hypothetical protein
LVETIGEGFAWNEFTHEVRACAIGQTSKAKDPRNANAFEAGHGNGLANERQHFRFVGVGREDLEGNVGAGRAIFGGPNFTTTTLAECSNGLISRRKKQGGDTPGV